MTDLEKIQRLEDDGASDRFTLLESDVLAVREGGDVAYFEFCLHQMGDPDRALLRRWRPTCS